MLQVALSPRASALRAACFTYLRPRLAQDAQIDLTPIVTSIRKGKPLSAQRDAITAAVRAVVKDKLAHDSDIEDVANLLDAIEDVVDSGHADVPEEMADDPDLERADVDDDGREELVRDEEGDPMIAKIREFLKNVGVPDEVMAQFDQLVSSEDEPEDVPDPREENQDLTDDRRRMAGDRGGAGSFRAGGAHAMDAAAVERLVARRVQEARVGERANARHVQAALRDVYPVVGEVALACDSAEDVYAAALGALGHQTRGVDRSAFKAMFEIARRAQASQARGARLAQDAVPAGVPSFAERFPAAARVRVG